MHWEVNATASQVGIIKGNGGVDGIVLNTIIAQAQKEA